MRAHKYFSNLRKATMKGNGRKHEEDAVWKEGEEKRWKHNEEIKMQQKKRNGKTIIKGKV
jgi:hypothetical protein